MSHVIAATDTIMVAASEVGSIGSAISAANLAAALPAIGIFSAGADELPTRIAELFGAHAAGYQKVAAEVAAFHDQFLHSLAAGAASYSNTEALGAETVRQLLNAINNSTVACCGRPLIGNGADGGPGTGQAGGAVAFVSETAVPEVPVGTRRTAATQNRAERVELPV